MQALQIAVLILDLVAGAGSVRTSWLPKTIAGSTPGLRPSGSEFETTARTTAGSKQIAVASVGDFKAGQGVTVSKCNVLYPKSEIRLYGGGKSISKGVGSPWKCAATTAARGVGWFTCWTLPQASVSSVGATT